MPSARSLTTIAVACIALATQFAAASPAPAATRAPAIRTTTLGQAELRTPRALPAGSARLRVSARFEHVGWIVLTLRRHGERISRGVLIATEPRTVGLALKIPPTLAPATYWLEAAYKPLGERKLTRVVDVRLT